MESTKSKQILSYPPGAGKSNAHLNINTSNYPIYTDCKFSVDPTTGMVVIKKIPRNSDEIGDFLVKKK